MDKLNKRLLISVMILALIIISNSTLFANNIVNPGKLTFGVYYGPGYYSTNLNCDLNLESSPKLEAKANSKIDTNLNLIFMDNFIVGAKVDYRISKKFYFSPTIEYQQNRVYSYTTNDEDILVNDESDYGFTSRYLNIPIMFNVYFSNGLYVGIGPKLNINLSSDKDQIYPNNSFLVSGSATVGYNLGNYGYIGLVADRTLTNIYDNDEDVISNYPNIKSISGNNLYIGLVVGFKLRIL